MNYEILNDAFWKATRFNFDSVVTDCFDGTRLTLKDYVCKMMDTINLSLTELGNNDIIETLEDVLEFGTEADEQINFEQENGKNKLLLYLMNNVEYDV